MSAKVSVEAAVEQLYRYGKQRCEALGINPVSSSGLEIFEFATRKREEAAAEDNPYLWITAWLEAVAVETFWEETQKRFGVTACDEPGTRVRLFDGALATLVGAMPDNKLFAAVVVDNAPANAGLRCYPFSELRLIDGRGESSGE